MYYYLREAPTQDPKTGKDRIGRPLITVCVLPNNDGSISRGMSICSPLDNPAKHIGRGKAYGRALRSNFLPKQSDFILRRESWETIGKIAKYNLQNGKLDTEMLDQFFQLKSARTTRITPFEMKLLRRVENAKS